MVRPAGADLLSLLNYGFKLGLKLLADKKHISVNLFSIIISTFSIVKLYLKPFLYPILQ